VVTECRAGTAPGRAPVRPTRPRSVRLLGWIERGCLGAGAALLLLFAGAWLDRELYRVQLASLEPAPAAAAETGSGPEADQSLWSEGRIARYRESLGLAFAPPLATLRIPRIGLEVPVLAGVDELSLNRAVGHIPGTAAPGEPGNVAIAGHRDGFFRGLKDLQVGDRIELEARGESQLYAVETLQVVDPGAVHVLDPTPAPALTLVTCYPFYFIGKAPQRYIVRAQALPPAGAGETADTE
jgi:sortase A